jgi:hypothetical protein
LVPWLGPLSFRPLVFVPSSPASQK